MVRAAARSPLDALGQWCRAFPRTGHAIMGGALGWLSERNLVAVTSNAGDFGALANDATDAFRNRHRMETAE
jgi:enoyl-[acyl-carrier protein] reductase II